MVPKYGLEKLKLSYKDTNSVVYEIKTEDFYEDIADDVPARFDTSGYCLNRPLPVGLNKKVIGLMKDELGSKIKFSSLTVTLEFFRVFLSISSLS